MVGSRKKSGASSCPVWFARALAALAFGLSAFGAARAADGEVGSIRGVVYDKDFDTPLAQVRVSIAEMLRTAATATDGHFVFEQVPPGRYTLAFSKDGYERQVVAGVAVAAGQLADVRVDLSAEIVTMDELVVTGSDFLANSDLGLLEIRQASVTLQDAISQEMLKRSGATDLAGALKLVVGTSVVGGKYASVRGLSDRYTGTTLNGVRVPSPDPRRRAVQVDQFPTGTIDSITVTKTFTPDLQGDFTGGGVDIKTKSIPDGPTLSISASLEHNSIATGNDSFLTYEGGGVGALGDDHGRHDLPQEADDPLPTFPRFVASPTPAQIAASNAYDRLVRSFSPVIGVRRDAPAENYGFSIVAGNRWTVGQGGVVGATGALTTSHKYDYYEEGRNNTGLISVADAPIALTRPRVDSRGTDSLLLGGLATFAWQPTPNHEVLASIIRNEATEDEARFQVQNAETTTIEQNQSLHYTERRVTSYQLHGRHTFPDLFGADATRFKNLSIDWVAAVNRTGQDEPDVRFFRNVFDTTTLTGEMPSNSTEAENTRRIFRDITENNSFGGLNVTVPFRQWSDSEGSLKAGALLDRTDRTSTQRSFTYKFATQFGSFLNPIASYNRSLARFEATSPDDLWTDIFLSPDRIGLAHNNPPAPNQLLWTIVPLGDDVDYTGDQRIEAYYAMGELPLSPALKVIGGARRETTDLSVVPKNIAFGKVDIINVLESGDREIVSRPQEETRADLHDGSLLPALGLIYEVKPNMNLRASWSRTIARPTFRELAPVATEEFLFGDEYIGNPALRFSKIGNYDLRWEWFRKPGEVWTFGLFDKELRNPIEQISFSAAGRSFVQPVNYETGRVYGVEIEARAPLDPLAGWLHGVGAGMNLTLIHSEVDVPPSEQRSLSDFGLDEPTRRLQGQPDFVFNFDLSYDNDRSGTSGGLFYNVVGETLLTGAARGVDGGNPNVFERPYHSLDLRVSQKVARNVSLAFKATNLLGSQRRTVYRTPNGEEAIKSLRDVAILFSIGASVTW